MQNRDILLCLKKSIIFDDDIIMKLCSEFYKFTKYLVTVFFQSWIHFCPMPLLSVHRNTCT